MTDITPVMYNRIYHIFDMFLNEPCIQRKPQPKRKKKRGERIRFLGFTSFKSIIIFNKPFTCIFDITRLMFKV